MQGHQSARAPPPQLLPHRLIKWRSGSVRNASGFSGKTRDTGYEHSPVTVSFEGSGQGHWSRPVQPRRGVLPSLHERSTKRPGRDLEEQTRKHNRREPKRPLGTTHPRVLYGKPTRRLRVGIRAPSDSYTHSSKRLSQAPSDRSPVQPSCLRSRTN